MNFKSIIIIITSLVISWSCADVKPKTPSPSDLVYHQLPVMHGEIQNVSI